MCRRTTPTSLAHRFTAWALLAVLTASGPSPSLAAFIIDDFDDAVELAAPEVIGDSVAVSEGVGPFDANREVQISATGGTLEGKLDVGITNASTLTAAMDRLDLFRDPMGRSSFGASYAFEAGAVDFTEGGENSVLIFELSNSQGQNLPDQIWSYVLESDDEGVPILAISPLPIFEEGWRRGSIFVPFDGFRPRGDERPDFADVDVFAFVFVSETSFDEGWSIEIDRIRVGNIPEPSALGLSIALVAVFGSAAVIGRNRRWLGEVAPGRLVQRWRQQARS